VRCQSHHRNPASMARAFHFGRTQNMNQHANNKQAAFLRLKSTHHHRPSAVRFCGTPSLLSNKLSRHHLTGNAGIISCFARGNFVLPCFFIALLECIFSIFIVVIRLGSLCANFVVVSPPLRNSTRDAAFPVHPDVVENWLQSLPNLSDSDSLHHTCVNANSDSAQQQHLNMNAPGGALVMEALQHTGMYAPTETRIFHHIILVGLLGLFRAFVAIFDLLKHTHI